MAETKSGRTADRRLRSDKGFEIAQSEETNLWKVLRMCGLVHGKTLRWGSLSYIVQWPEWNRMTGGSDFRTGPDTIRTCDQRIMSSENDNDD